MTLTCAGQAGWMGKGSNGESADKDKSEHVSQPISSLKDPSSFGPPPRHVNYHGAAAVPNQTTPDRRGLGAPLSQDQTANQSTHYQQEEAEEEEPQRPAPPPVPYRANTTGLSTDHLPPPPRRTDSASPASTNSFNKPKPPKPPPRLPARNGSPSNDPPPAYSSGPVVSHDYINQDASSRLASAGVSVPGFGIGEQDRKSPANAPVNELQSRFSQMNTGSGSPAPPPPARTPTSESQPGSSGSSIQNFRERHGDKIDAGKQKYGDFRERHADSIDSGKQKYGDFRERHADTIDSGKQKVGDFRERHADSIDAGKQKLSGVTSRFTGSSAAPPPPPGRPSTTSDEATRSTSSVQDFRERHADKIDSGKQKYGDFRERHADTIDSGKQKYGDFRERHADSIDAGKHKLSGYKSRLTGSPAPTPPARPESSSPSMNLEPAEPARGSSSVQDFRERHADKIDMGKEKWGGVTSRFNTFVEDRKFSNEANKRIPRPPARPSSGAAAQSPTEDLQGQAQRKKPPPPPPKRAEIRAPATEAPSPGPPPIPHGTKPR